jgi:hypothetical protein
MMAVFAIPITGSIPTPSFAYDRDHKHINNTALDTALRILEPKRHPMRLWHYAAVALGGAMIAAGTLPAYTQSPPGHGGHSPSVTLAAPVAPSDTRQMVKMPDMMVEHMLSNMRDHLLALEDIQAAISRSQWDIAAKIAEQRIGMSSLEKHGGQQMAGFMPQGMQDAGTAMHHAASKFAVAAKDADVTGDWKSAVAALAAITTNCNGCHAGYRVR